MFIQYSVQQELKVSNTKTNNLEIKKIKLFVIMFQIVDHTFFSSFR